MSERKRVRSCKRVSIVCGGSEKTPNGKTQQHFKSHCDVNSIVEKARRSGLISHLNAKKPMFADVSSIPDYQSALAAVNVARESFSGLSSKVRERFNNDPARMVSFLSDKDNFDEAVKLGLFVKKVVEPEKVQKVEVVNPAKPDDTAKPTK